MSPHETLRTVLVADDNHDIVDTTATMLEFCGYRTLKAYGAREALNRLDEHAEVALLISDIRMPEVDGFDLLRVVRHRFRTLPVVLMTGYPVTDDDVVPSGATILPKPFTLPELKAALATRLAEGQPPE